MMSRQLEQLQEDRNAKRNRAILRAVEYELEQNVTRAGAELRGLAVKFGNGDCLLVIKGVLAGRQQVAFVGSMTLGDGLVKATRLAGRDQLVWKEDRYVGES